MGVPDLFEFLVFGGVVLLIILLVFFLDHRTRLQKLEDRLAELEREQKPGEEKVPERTASQEERRASPMEQGPESGAEEAQETQVQGPPPLPPQRPKPPVEEVAPMAAKEAPPRAVEQPAPTPAPEPGEHPLADWLEKIGMKPPQADDEDANLIAWWSTRAGLGLGVIAAVFFGLYVNQNTVPWVRLVELVALAVALFAGGCWLEGKQGAFGRALTAGGLGLLYVAAYASFGLPAMKVIESALVGSVMQLVAVGLMAGWALWKRNEGVFSLSLVLGYVTSWFSYQEGVEPLPVVSVVVLAAAGSALFAMRGWWSGLWASLVGSSVGMILLAVFSWWGGGGPEGWLGLGVVCLLTVFFVAGLFLRRESAAAVVAIALPLVTSAGVVVGAVVTWTLGLEWEWYYASFAVLLLLAGWLWRASKEALWEVMWAKAAVFVALYLIAALEGPVRAYGLLAQAGSLAYLAQRRGWVVFDVGALLAMVVGWAYVVRELAVGPVASWGVPEAVVLGFLAGALGIVAWFGRGEGDREKLAFPVLVLLALGVFWTAVWRVEHDWVVLAALLGAVVFVGVGRWVNFWRAELLAAVFLLPMLTVFQERGQSWGSGGMEVSGVAWPLVLWLVAAWAYCEWLVRDGGQPGRVLGIVLMLFSVLGVHLAAVEFCGSQWAVVVLLAVGVLWRVLDRRVALPDLRLLSAAPALLGSVLVLAAWDSERPALLLAVALLATVAYWGYDLLEASPGESGGMAGWMVGIRAVVLGFVLFTSLHLWTEGSAEVMVFGFCAALLVGICRQFGEPGSGWLGVVAALLALGFLTENRGRDGWHTLSVAVLFVVFVSSGLVLARGGKGGMVALPKFASLLWGGLSLLSVLLGLVVVGEVAGWTTAGCALGAVLLLVAGFWGGLRGYRVLGLLGIGFAILRLFVVDLDEIFWRIVAFGVTGALLVGIGYIYNRFNRQLAEHDLDWRKGEG